MVWRLQDVEVDMNTTLKSLLVLLSLIFVVNCSQKIENLPQRWDSLEQRTYAMVCAGCHENAQNIPVIASNGKLAKSGRDVTVQNVVNLLQTPDGHKLNYKDALSDQELRDTALWIIHDRTRDRPILAKPLK